MSEFGYVQILYIRGFLWENPMGFNIALKIFFDMV